MDVLIFDKSDYFLFFILIGSHTNNDLFLKENECNCMNIGKKRNI